MGASRTEASLAFSPWALFDDSPDGVLVLNAYARGRPTRLFREGDELRSLLESGQGRTVKIRDSLVAELAALGVVQHEPLLAARAPHAQDSFGRRPFLNRIDVGVELGAARGRQGAELRGLRTALERAGDESPSVRLTLYGFPGVGPVRELLREIGNLWGDSAHREQAPDLRWRTSPGQPGSCSPEELRALLDEWPDLQLVVEDLGEVVADQDDEAQRAVVRDLASDGFPVRVALPSRCGADLADRVRAWELATDFGGVLGDPLVTDRYAGLAARPLDTAEDFEAAAGGLARAAETLGSSLLKSEPWASILVHAALPGVLREGASRRVAGAFLTASGRWARTREHAASFLFGPPARMLPTLFPQEGRGELESGPRGGESEPDCPACSFGPLCDGFWRPEIDLLRRTGHSQRAARVAAFECEIRMQTLPTLLAEIRAEQNQIQSNGRTVAVYQNDRLTFPAADTVVNQTPQR